MAEPCRRHQGQPGEHRRPPPGRKRRPASLDLQSDARYRFVAVVHDRQHRETQGKQGAGPGQMPGKACEADQQKPEQRDQGHGTPGSVLAPGRRPRAPRRAQEVGQQRQQEDPARHAVLRDQLQRLVVCVVVLLNLDAFGLEARDLDLPGACPDTRPGMGPHEAQIGLPHGPTRADGRVAGGWAGRQRHLHPRNAALQCRAPRVLLQHRGVVTGQVAQSQEDSDQRGQRETLLTPAPERPCK
jgi:hypothetical protein